MRASYKFGEASVSGKDLKWMLQHIAETGPQPYRDSAFVFEEEDDTGTVSKKKVRVMERDLIQWMARKLSELGSGYW